MSCYHFNRQDILQKAKERYSKEKADQQLIQYKKEALQNKWVLFFTQYKNEWKDSKIWQY